MLNENIKCSPTTIATSKINLISPISLKLIKYPMIVSLIALTKHIYN